MPRLDSQTDLDYLIHGDIFKGKIVEQVRVLRLVPEDCTETTTPAGGSGPRFSCAVVVWHKIISNDPGENPEWVVVESRTPHRRGKALPFIPFVFHGPRHSRPDVDRLPSSDIISVNLDHFRLNADYKHGVHYTALPTAWVVGFDKGTTPRIGSATA